MQESFYKQMMTLGLSPADNIAVAVSGGGDSMALAVLLKDFCKGRLLALTVDHGLRKEAAAEAQQVHDTLTKFGIEHRVLTWQGEKPETHIQERARDARYELMLSACLLEGIRFLSVAHNAEDLAETFWMRLAHGSGLDGLAGMAARRQVQGVDIIRPLMSFTREELRGYCREKNVSWIEDPSNANEKYLRVRLREFEETLAQEGFTPSRLAATLQKLGDAKDALRFFADDVFSKSVTVHAEGYLSLDAQNLASYPADIRRRVVERCLAVFGQGKYPTPFEALCDLCVDIQAAGFSGRTLGGCEVFPSDGKILFTREEAAVEGRKNAAEGILWDGRFLLSGFGPEYEVGALSESGISALRKTGADMPFFEALPFKIKKTLPAIWQGEKLQAVPQVSWYSSDAPEGLKRGQIRFKIV